MITRALLLSSCVAFALIIIVLLLYYKEQLKEDFVILWILICTSIIIVSLCQGLLKIINMWIVSASRIVDFVFTSYIGILIMIGIYMSLKLSQHEKKIIALAQEVALLRTLVSEYKKYKLRHLPNQ